ncbi:MAG: hypothetical protein WAW96_05155, partial [Alphaproteobacteria bacterium]
RGSSARFHSVVAFTKHWTYITLGDDDFRWGYAIIGNPAFAEWGFISFTELKHIRVPPGIEVDCELFDPPLRASEIEGIRIP